MVTINQFRDAILSLPNVTEGVSYGTPSFKVNGKFLGRIMEDGHSISINVLREEREAWLSINNNAFSVPEHFEKYDYMVIDLRLTNMSELRDVLQNAWELRTNKK